jgi:periplasmic protein TonB
MALESFSSGESGPSLRRFATSYGAAFVLVGGLLGALALVPKKSDDKAEAVVDIRLVLPPPPEPEPPPPPPKPLEVPKPKPAAKREIAKIEKAPEPPPPEPPKPTPPAPAPLGLGQPKGPAKPGQATVSSGSLGGAVGGTGTGTGRVVPAPTASAAPPPPKVVALSEDTEPPVAAGANAMPAYPAALKSEGVEGFVVVRFIITEAGAVDDLRIVKSSDPRFNDAVLAAVKTWRFKPATSQGRPVPYPKTIKIPFKIRT